MNVRFLFSVALGASVAVTSSVALAQTRGVATTGDKDGKEYGYRFDDDSLSAGNAGPSGLNVRVRPMAVRQNLLKPRTKFIDELLRSITNI